MSLGGKVSSSYTQPCNWVIKRVKKHQSDNNPRHSHLPERVYVKPIRLWKWNENMSCCITVVIDIRLTDTETGPTSYENDIMESEGKRKVIIRQHFRPCYWGDKHSPSLTVSSRGCIWTWTKNRIKLRKNNRDRKVHCRLHLGKCTRLMELVLFNGQWLPTRASSSLWGP